MHLLLAELLVVESICALGYSSSARGHFPLNNAAVFLKRPAQTTSEVVFLFIEMFTSWAFTQIRAMWMHDKLLLASF